MSQDFVAEEAWALLEAHGLSADDIAAAEAGGRLHLLVLEVLLDHGEGRYSVLQVAEQSGMDAEHAMRLWGALGLPADDQALTERDVDALTTVHGLMQLGLAEPEAALELAAVLAEAMGKVADAALPLLRSHLDSARAAELFALTGSATLESVARLLDYGWRRRLWLAVQDRITSAGEAGGGDAEAGQLH